MFSRYTARSLFQRGLISPSFLPALWPNSQSIVLPERSLTPRRLGLFQVVVRALVQKIPCSLYAYLSANSDWILRELSSHYNNLVMLNISRFLLDIPLTSTFSFFPSFQMMSHGGKMTSISATVSSTCSVTPPPAPTHPIFLHPCSTEPSSLRRLLFPLSSQRPKYLLFFTLQNRHFFRLRFPPSPHRSHSSR